MLPKIYYWALIVVISFIFIPHWLVGNVYGSFDLASITIPLEDVFANYQRSGEVPVWTPEFQAGTPLIANAIQSFFYLPHVVLRQVLPGVLVANFSLFFHLCLAGMGMQFLLRSQGIQRLPAFFGALIFSLGGYFIGRITLPHLFFPAAWIPLILWALFALWDKPTIYRVGIFSVTVAAQVFSGHIQIFFYTLLLMLIAVGVLYTRSATKNIWARVYTIAAAAGLVFLLTAVAIWPVLELMPQSKRSAALTGVELLDVSYPPAQLIQWVYPTIFGRGESYTGAKNEPELMEYIGIIGLIAVFFGFLDKQAWKSPLGLTAIVCIGVGLLLAGGQYSPPFLFWLKIFPAWGLLANPGRAIILVHIGAVIVATFGFQAMLHRTIPVHRHRLGMLLIFLTFFELCYFGIFANPVYPLTAWLVRPKVLVVVPTRTDAPRIYSHKKLFPASPTDFSPNVGFVIGQSITAQQTMRPQQDNWQSVAVGLTWNGKNISSGKVVLEVLGETGDVIRTASISGNTVGNGELVTFSFDPISHSKDILFRLRLRSSYPATSAPTVIIMTNQGGFDYNPTGVLERCTIKSCVVVTAPDWHANADLNFILGYVEKPVIFNREILLPVIGESLGQKMVRGHLTLQLGRIYRYLYAMGERGDVVESELIPHRQLLDRLSVGTIVASYPEHRLLEGMPGLARVATYPLQNRYLQVYRNEQAFPRLGFAGQVRRAKSAEDALSLLVSNAVESDTVVVEGLPFSMPLSSTGTATAKIMIDTAQKVTITTNTESAKLLVLRDAMYTGWQASLDGVATPIYTIDSLFRGVVVPSGEHSVVFSYHPIIYRRSLIVSSMSWIMVVGFLAWRGRNVLTREKKLKKILERTL